MVKQHSMLFQLMMSVLLINNVVLSKKKCRILVCDNIFLGAKKRGCYNQRGAIFGVNTVYRSYYAVG